jgi:hypothetical protein
MSQPVSPARPSPLEIEDRPVRQQLGSGSVKQPKLHARKQPVFSWEPWEIERSHLRVKLSLISRSLSELHNQAQVASQAGTLDLNEYQKQRAKLFEEASALEAQLATGP